MKGDRGMANRRNSAWTVLAAALALVVHLFIAGLASAALAAPGAFVICSGAGKAAIPDPGEQRKHSGITDCCLTSCPAAGGTADLPAASTLFPPPRDSALPLLAPAGGANGPSHERSPINPRGPPLAA